jgi:hypothetical protein
MDDKRRLYKQIFIAVVYFAIFTGIGTGIYFLVRPEPVPPPPPAPTIYPLESLWVQPFLSGPGVYSVAARIRNPNTGFGSSDFSYTFYMYDSGGNLLEAKAGKSFIWPGESKYLIEAGINNLTRAPVRVELVFGEPVWQEVKDFKGVNLNIGNISYGKGAAKSGKFFMIDAVASNGTSYNLDKVYVSAVVFGAGDSPIAVNPTVLENLKAGERRPFSLAWFSPFLGTAVKVDLSVSTNLWERPELLSQ